MAEPDEGLKNKADSESEDESEVLEESPCGRWQKRREEVEQRDVPGIDNAFLAMDTEEGVEVVWNEVQFSGNRNLKEQQTTGTTTGARRKSSIQNELLLNEKIRRVFNSLIQLDHPNIVKFHKYWTDTKDGRPRVIFITEYMSSGSLKQFLKRTKKNNKTFQLKAWKRWCTQILSALSYLHSCDIIHGNLTCDTIFIQHNGLIKIGSVAPDAMHIVKTYRKDIKNMHCVAPEYEDPSRCTTAIDIYSFGMCALEIAALGFQGNGGEGGGTNHVTEEAIEKTLASLENPLQKDFIAKCIQKDPKKRPQARELLFHEILFEVHSLVLLSAHTIVHSANLPENLTDQANKFKLEPNQVIAEITHPEGREGVLWRVSQSPPLEREKLLEDVRNGIFPLTAFNIPTPPPKPRAKTPEVEEMSKSEDPEPVDVENRLVMQSSCAVKRTDELGKYNLTLQLKMDDKMNRQLTAEFNNEDTSENLAQELVHYGFINKSDLDSITRLIEDSIRPTIIENGFPESVATA
ncbi:nuclear receptor-binding protein-like isoform X1 [Ostrea edulis]|uniref:nuclear receptor-binding protein-like isoform X1 n=1 Tax=Ostrea edulis TaxID=37623 RepID=UPI002094F2A0|nr:nuclear receptor-binding protein-like isoform X1 [Ostrea edulis]